MLLATFAVPPDGLKFLFLVLVGGGLLALGRWSSRLGPTASGNAPGNTPTPDTAELLRGEESNPKIWPPSAEEIAASLPFDPALGNLVIRKLYFKKADAIPGPDDPEVFADELNIELYDPGFEARLVAILFRRHSAGIGQVAAREVVEISARAGDSGLSSLRPRGDTARSCQPHQRRK